MFKRGYETLPLWLIVLLISALLLIVLVFLIIKNKIISGVFAGI